MRISRTDRRPIGRWRGIRAATVALLVLGPPLHGHAQELRDVVSHQIAVSRDEASLQLELAGDGETEISLRDGVLRVGGEEIGHFDADDPLVSAWRELLARAVTLDDGALARALETWTPPAGLEDGSAEAGRRIDEALERALSVPPGASGTGEVRVGQGSEEDLVRGLLGRTDRLVDLASALDGLQVADGRVRIGEDVVVGEDETFEGSLVVVDGDLEVRGEIDGDVVVVGGTLRTFEGSRITGDVRVADGRLVREGGVIEGDWTQVDEETGRREMRDRLREELRRELRDELRSDLRSTVRSATRVDHDGGWSFMTPLRSFGRALAALLGDLMKTVVLALLGGAVIFFGRRNLEVVAETARRAPGRAAVVGLSGAFLLLPVYVLGTVALAISIIGIPVLIAWLPLFPVAVAVAMALGYYAAACNAGEWLAGRRYPGTDWIRSSNVYTLVVGGVVALMVPFLLADVVRMAGSWMGFLRGLLVTVGVLASVAATVVGFGAVLLTRAGRRPEYYGGTDFFDDWDFGGPSSAPSPGPEPPTPEGPAPDSSGTGPVESSGTHGGGAEPAAGDEPVPSPGEDGPGSTRTGETPSGEEGPDDTRSTGGGA